VPRYLMGIGDPETIRHAIYAWFDMFDCVMPTRLGRHGIAYSDHWNLHLRNACYRNDHTPLWPEAKNWLSKIYTKAYIHHLLREKEMLGWLILSLHNIFYLHQMVTEIREDIMNS
jgi:queuine tRNA-ribosyltransferase